MHETLSSAGKESIHSTPNAKCEIKIRHKRFTKDGGEEEVDVGSLRPVESDGERSAMTVTRSFDERDRLKSTTLEISSPYILKALRNVVGSHPTIASDFLEPFEMESPFQMLHHHWEDLDAYRTKVEGTGFRTHLGLLFDFMHSDLEPEKKRCDAQLRSGLIDYAHLWVIFRPGDKVVHYVKSQPWLLTVSKTAYEEVTAGKFMEVHCLHPDHDGTSFGEAKIVFKIWQKKDFPQDNPAKICDLGVFPRSFVREDKELESRLRLRGNEFMSLTSMTVHNYDGPSEYLKDPPPDYFHPNETDDWIVWISHYESGRIVLDRRTYQEDNHHAPIAKKPREALDPTCCPPYVFGYSCSRKRWCRFFLPYLREANWKANAFDDLVLPSNQKTLVRALVSSHTFPESSRDQSLQKGKGLVMLLHGPPGSGKTLTAECAAELTQRALFSTSMSELNKYNSAWYFEKRLSEVLRLATTWKAVVLLDEADVFLETRRDDSTDAAERNALVAVFLKHLEYFSGIVFLTTNRIRVFDVAMKSRVHLALTYSAPNQDSRRRIWSQNLRKLSPTERDVEIEDLLDVLSEEQMNGREISNAVTTACTLARFGEEPLNFQHIEAVLGVRREFETTLRRMRAVAVSQASIEGSADGPLVKQGSLLSEEPKDVVD